jgi:AraC family transcriptional regulator of adaptative response/methylated-DNA-[protein]-cysteine methyltransferase
MNSLAKKARPGAATVQDPRWTDVVARNAEADGKFYFGVRTTGVYCRPSCGARTARPENVSFYATREEAQTAGFRPCKRCRPDRSTIIDPYAVTVTQACRIIEESEATPTLKELARQLAMSAYHFHRVFRQVTGLTPGQYAAAQREKKVRHQLGRGSTVTTAIFDAGYSSSSRPLPTAGMRQWTFRCISRRNTAISSGAAMRRGSFVQLRCSYNMSPAITIACIRTCTENMYSRFSSPYC